MNQFIEEAIDPKQQVSFYIDYSFKGIYLSTIFQDLQRKQASIGYFMEPNQLMYHLRTPAQYPEIGKMFKCFVTTCVCLAFLSIIHMFIMFKIVDEPQEEIELQALYIALLVGTVLGYIYYTLKKRWVLQARLQEYFNCLNRDVFLPNNMEVTIEFGCNWKGYLVKLKKVRGVNQTEQKLTNETTS